MGFGGGKAPAPVQIPQQTTPEKTAPVDEEAAATAKTRQAEDKLRKGRKSLRIDLADGVGGGSIGSGVAIAG